MFSLRRTILAVGLFAALVGFRPLAGALFPGIRQRCYLRCGSPQLWAGPIALLTMLRNPHSRLVASCGSDGS